MPDSIQKDAAVKPQANEDIFLAAAHALADDPMFGIPQDVRNILAKHGKSTKVVMLGTNGFGVHQMHLKPELRNCEVIAAVDDFRSHKGQLYYDVPIISTDKFLEMVRQQGDIVAVNTCRVDNSKRFFDQICRSRGIPHLNFEQSVRAFGLHGLIDYRVADWGQQIVRNIPKYLELARRFGDRNSVDTLYGVLCFHLTCDPEHYHEIERPYSTLYFRSGLLNFTNQEKMVDCGASIGESLQGLIGTTGGEFKRSWMIEPDRFNIKTLQGVLRTFQGTTLESRISLHACGVGETEMRVPFNHEGGHGGFIKPSMAESDGADMIDVRPIDQIVDDAPTFIKMDIEGSELGALKGARNVIKDHKPKLAVSAYHRASDLIDLSDYVFSVNPEYKVGLRHHTYDRWDTCLYFY